MALHYNYSIFIGWYYYGVLLAHHCRNSVEMVVHMIRGQSDFEARKASTQGLVVVDFSATWCGPCKKIAPIYDQLSDKYTDVLFLTVMEDTNKDVIAAVGIRAFPTFHFYIKGDKVDEMTGADASALEQKINENNAKAPKAFEGAGFALSDGKPALSPAEAREARLKRLGGGSAPSSTAPRPSTTPSVYANAMADAEAADDAPAPPSASTDETAMEVESGAGAAGAGAMETEPPVPPVMEVPSVDAEMLKQMTDMGFAQLHAHKALLAGRTLDGAVEWLMAHQGDADIDEPIPPVPVTSSGTAAAAAAGGPVDENGQAASLRCADCGKLLRDMVAAEIHASKTNHANFEESTEAIKPLTPEEKAAKVQELKDLIAAKRKERLANEKAEAKTRELSRRDMGQKMSETKEQMEAVKRKHEMAAQKKEKEAYKAERERLRAQIAADKAERAARGGKLSTKLGVGGYNPALAAKAGGEDDEAATGAGAGAGGGDGGVAPRKVARKAAAEVRGMEGVRGAIDRLSQYRAGGDGLTALRTLLAYIGNVVNKPEEKYRKINLENAAFKRRVGGLIGGVALLKAVGFSKTSDSTLELLPEDEDAGLLGEAKAALEAAIAKLG